MEGEGLLRSFHCFGPAFAASVAKGLQIWVFGMFSGITGGLALPQVARGAAVYLVAGYALSQRRDCAIDDRLGAEASRPMARTCLQGPNDRRCDAPEWRRKPRGAG